MYVSNGFYTMAYWCLFSDVMMLSGILFLLNCNMLFAYLYLLVVQESYSEGRKTVELIMLGVFGVFFFALQQHVQESASLPSK